MKPKTRIAVDYILMHCLAILVAYFAVTGSVRCGRFIIFWNWLMLIVHATIFWADKALEQYTQKGRPAPEGIAAVLMLAPVCLFIMEGWWATGIAAFLTWILNVMIWSVSRQKEEVAAAEAGAVAAYLYTAKLAADANAGWRRALKREQALIEKLEEFASK